MLRIAICDDESTAFQQIQDGIELFQNKNPEIEFETMTFQSPSNLLSYLNKKKVKWKKEGLFDCYFLDVKMDGINGIELAQKLRDQGDESPIIYTTFYREYAYEAFGVHAMDYLIKPVQEENVAAILEKIGKNIQFQQERSVSVKNKFGIHNIKIEDILYVENQSRRATYVLRNGDVVQSNSNRGTFEESIAPLPELPEFVQAHKSFLINMQYVAEMQEKFFIMRNGKEIPISKKRYTHTKQSYLKYLTDTGSEW